MKLQDYIGAIPDFPKPGILFRDISPLLASPAAFAAALAEMARGAKALGVQQIAAIESRGFVFGAPLAKELEVGLVLLRKPGKLPGACLRREYTLEYGTAALELQEGRIEPGTRVLLIDDLLATGGTARAAAELVEEAGGTVAQVLFLIELIGLGGREALGDRPVERLLEFDA
ncbi:MAG: adenine phosphoribosyltransferase [Gemmatimonadetes bacterium]|nr:adenine phosphoribosyltransferase [Gemmatimonadota bacterium]